MLPFRFIERLYNGIEINVPGFADFATVAGVWR